MNSSHRIAIILARGGSKRLPRKNLLDFFGKPLIAWTIEAALESGCFEKVVVSTDDTEIAETAVMYGAEAPFLRNSAADDFSTSSQATYVGLMQSLEYWPHEYETVVQLMANCPLRDSNDIVASINSFEMNNAPSQISCFKYGWMNPWWAAKIDSKGIPHRIFETTKNIRSQDLPNLYGPTGAIWISKVDDFLVSKDFYMKGHRFEELSLVSSMDIDDESDFEMAKALYILKNRSVTCEK